MGVCGCGCGFVNVCMYVDSSNEKQAVHAYLYGETLYQ